MSRNCVEISKFVGEKTVPKFLASFSIVKKAEMSML